MGMTRDKSWQAAEEAAMWLQRLREEDSPQTREAFSAWMGKGAENLQEFLFAQALWKEMDGIDAQMRTRLEKREDGSAAVIDFPSEEREHRRPSSVTRRGRPGSERRFIGFAAAMLVCILAGGYWWATSRNTYATEVGEQKTVKLEDGSVIHLNTGSRVKVELSDAQRRIRLMAGEALFTVEQDARRPFEVLTDSARVRALGTTFNVYRSSDRQTRVAVMDGAVQVSSLLKGSALTLPTTGAAKTMRLKAGDEADVDAGRVVKTRAPNVERAMSWRARRLEFPGNPVGEIAAEFNRYNKTPIQIEGNELRSRRMSGVFDADDPSPLVRYLERDPGIEVIRSGGEIVIRPVSAQ